MIVIRIIFFILGAALAAYTFYAAALTFVVPRSSANFLSGMVFRPVRRIFRFIAARLSTYEQRDAFMSLYAPLSLLLLVPFWLLVTALGFSMIYWALGITPWTDAFIASGSSLLTLGYVGYDSLILHLFSFTEATIGLMLVAMLIAYLPTMYSAFQQREAAVSLLEVRAGTPPTAAELIWRLYGIEPDISDRKRFWESWEQTFTEIDESHTTLPALVFFRSPRTGQSWVVAAGVVLDAAALQQSAVEEPHLSHTLLAIRAGRSALSRIADFFEVPYNPDPHYPADPIHVSRAEFDAALNRLAAQGVPVREDRDLAWRNFAGWRVTYDSVLVALSRMTMAPEAPWLAEKTFVPPDLEGGETAGSLQQAE
jgi:hypothetical protein